MLTQHDRHRRIHEAQQDGQPPLPVPEEDLENEDNDFNSNDEGSSPSDMVPSTVINPPSMVSMPPAMTMPPTMHPMVAPHMIAPQLLQQQI